MINECKALIDDTRGKIFVVDFRKRTKRHEIRRMVCRTGVHKHLHGGPPAYDPRDHGLVWVYDLQAKGYRSIPVDNVVMFKCGAATAGV